MRECIRACMKKLTRIRTHSINDKNTAATRYISKIYHGANGLHVRCVAVVFLKLCHLFLNPKNKETLNTNKQRAYKQPIKLQAAAAFIQPQYKQ